MTVIISFRCLCRNTSSGSSFNQLDLGHVSRSLLQHIIRDICIHMQATCASRHVPVGSIRVASRQAACGWYMSWPQDEGTALCRPQADSASADINMAATCHTQRFAFQKRLLFRQVVGMGCMKLRSCSHFHLLDWIRRRCS